jgi:MFS family permease
MGRWADRAGVHVPLFSGGVGTGLGFIAASMSGNIWWFAPAPALAADHGCRQRTGPAVAAALWPEPQQRHVFAVRGTALVFAFQGPGLDHIISALFGLFQGGIVPAYAVILREYFPAKEAGSRVGAVIMATLLGMGLGGWMSGKVFDLTGSYHAAFINGVLWNALNLSIALWLLWRVKRAAVQAA